MKHFLTILFASIVAITSVSAQSEGRSSVIIRLDGGDYYIHTVIGGETLYHLSQLYSVDVAKIIELNPACAEGLRVDQKVKLPCNSIERDTYSKRRYERTFDEHVVAKGETLYSVARFWGLSVDVLLVDNPGIDPASLSIGQVLRIRKDKVGESTTHQISAQVGEVTSSMNDVSGSVRYHQVLMGETVYSLSRMYGIDEQTLKSANDLSEGLKAGSIIKIPVAKGSETDQADQSTDQTYPTVTEARNDIADGTEISNLNNQSPSIDYVRENCHIAMLLPLTDSVGGVRSGFVEFYQGALVALNELKRQGYTLTLDLFDTHSGVRSIVNDAAFRRSNLIVGPVYENELEPVVDYARRNRMAVVSPLVNVEGDFGGTLFELSPDPDRKFDKVGAMFTPDKNIVLIRTGNGTGDDVVELQRLADKAGYRSVTFDKSRPAALENYVDSDKTNLFVVVGGSETNVESVLSSLSSILNRRQSRSIATGQFEVVGNSRWLRFRNIDRDLFFKLNTTFVTSYHADRGNQAVRSFDASYLESFGAFPSLYSYRGYDAVKLFADAVMTPGFDFVRKLNDSRQQLLQVPYRFVMSGGNYVNDEWVVVHYCSNHRIETE